MRRVSNEVLTMTLRINGDQSRQELKGLEKEADKLRASMSKAAKAGLKDFAEVEKELQAVEQALKEASEATEVNDKEVKKLTRSADKLIKELAAIKTAEQDFVKFGNELADVNAKMDGTRQKIDITSLSMEELSRETYRLRMELRKANPNTELFEKFENELQQITNRTKELNGGLIKLDANFDRNKASIEQLEQRQKALNATMRKLSPDDAKLRQYRLELEKVRGRMTELTQGAGSMRQKFDAFAMKANNYQTMLMGVGAALYGVHASAQLFIQGISEMSDKVSDVQKTTGLAKGEVLSMMQTFKTFNTRTPQTELLGLARIAGKLGITGKKDITDFVREANKINVSLSEDLGGDVEETIRLLGKMTESFGLVDQFGTAESLNKVGSAINTIGASSTASEQYLVDFTNRLAGTAPLAKISITDVLGLASTYDQLGQSAEITSTVMNQVLPDMFRNTDLYAKISGKSVKDFSELLNTDANAALIEMLKGLKGNNAGLAEMTKKLDTLGIDGSRGVAALSVLANNIDMLTKEQKLANEEFEKGTSLTNEYNIKNENLAANLDKVKKALHSMFINGAIMQGVEKIIGLFAKWVEIPVSESLREENSELNILVQTIASGNITAEERLTLMNKLQDSYPDMLKNLNTETVTNEQLLQRLQLVNKEYEKKYLLALQEEKLKPKFQEQARLYERQMQLVEAITKAENDAKNAPERKEFFTNSSGRQQVRLGKDYYLNLAEQLRGERADVIKEREALQAEILKLQTFYKNAFDSITVPSDGVGAVSANPPSRTPTVGGVVGEKEKKKKKKKDKYQQPEAFDQIQATAEIALNFLAEVDKMHDANHAARLAKNKEHYENQQKLFREHAEKMKRIEEGIGALGDITMSIMETNMRRKARMYGEDSEEYKKEAIKLAMAKLAVDTAMSISSIIAASNANPNNAWTFGGAGMIQLGSGLAQLYANIETVRGAIAEAKQYYSGKYNVKGADDGRMYNVPFQGAMQTGMYNQPALVAEHGNELIFAHHDLMKPYVYKHVQAAVQASKVKQYATGNATGDAAGVGNMDNLLMVLIGEVRALNQRPVKAQVSYFDIEEKQDKISEIRSRVTPKAK